MKIVFSDSRFEGFISSIKPMKQMPIGYFPDQRRLFSEEWNDINFDPNRKWRDNKKLILDALFFIGFSFDRNIEKEYTLNKHIKSYILTYLSKIVRNIFNFIFTKIPNN